MRANRMSLAITAAIFILVVLATPSMCAQALLSSERQKELDAYALAAPAFQSVKALGAYLAKPAKNDLEKTRLIYRWITANIAYDAASFFTGAQLDSGAESTLRSGKAVCQGYSELFAELARLSGLEVAVISGFAKGYGIAPGSVIDKPNHAWNAVKFDGRWHLLDPTWGAVHIGSAKTFETNPPVVLEYFFLTEPDEFVFSHLPSDDKWQLLTKTVTKKEFYEYAGLNEYFFIYGIKTISHKKPVIEANGPVTIKFEAPSDVLLTARLNDSERTIDSAVFLQSEGAIKVARVAPPKHGEYSVEIFAKRKTDGNRYTKVLEYKIISKTSTIEPAFPRVYGNFYDKNIELKEPMNGRLKTNSIVRFIVIAPGALRVAVIDGSDWTILEKSGDVYTGEVRIKSSKPIVSANYSGDVFDTLLEYVAY